MVYKNNSLNNTANEDFLVTTAAAGTDRKLSITNTDNTAAASAAHVQVTVGGATSTGDPYTNYLVTGAGTFSTGIDNSDSDLWKLTTGVSPSAGTLALSCSSTGVLNAPVMLNVGSSAPVDIAAQFTNEFSVNGSVVSVACRNLSNTGASDAVLGAAVAGSSAGDPYTVYTIAGVANGFCTGIDNSDSDKFKITNAVTPSTGVTAMAIDTSGNVSIPVSLTAPGHVIQYIQASKTATQDCSTVMPGDDTIPQNTEGDEVLTCAITPKSATNLLVIKFNTFGTMSATRFVDVGLFQDATAGALAASVMGSGAVESWFNGSLFYKMVSGTTSATTFKIRIGPSAAGNVYVNGSSGGRVFGGVASTTLEIWEIAV